jgi:nucleotide-binding universal stress UspA family protein
LNAWPCPVLGSLSCKFHTIKHAIIRRLITIPRFTENRCEKEILLDRIGTHEYFLTLNFRTGATKMILPTVAVKKILYTTDLSETAFHAFAYAVSLANLYGASITILHVLFEDPDIDSKIAPYIGDDQWQEIKKRHYQEAREALIGKKRDNVAIREVLHTFSENVKASSDDPSFVTDEIIVERGNPVEQILKVADERNCDLIVMGSHGHGAIEEALIGSTAKKVIRRSKKPVLVVRLP